MYMEQPSLRTKEQTLEDLVQRMTELLDENARVNKELMDTLNYVTGKVSGYLHSPLLVRLYRAWKGRL